MVVFCIEFISLNSYPSLCSSTLIFNFCKLVTIEWIRSLSLARKSSAPEILNPPSLKSPAIVRIGISSMMEGIKNATNFINNHPELKKNNNKINYLLNNLRMSLCEMG